MSSLRLAGITMLLIVINTLCYGAITRNDRPNKSATVLGHGSIKVHDGPNGKDTVLDGPNGSIKVLDKGKLTGLGGHKVRRDIREANASVIEHLGPNASTVKPHSSNTPKKVRREANATETLHRVPLMRGRFRREATEKELNAVKASDVTTLKPATNNATDPETATTPARLGNMITVPDNCPDGKKYVDGACREMWESSR
ncbi:uncharacterized protein LOC133521502 [Cydia pomonella]|uniref:uncharacterized protein LOC133521502 n=1 Tax=Cydia pomonella TaxID=82600 RepID=UPI002ADD9F90|nr:uncharacterized protein LOC133521502 [Cydia pomonella]